MSATTDALGLGAEERLTRRLMGHGGAGGLLVIIEVGLGIATSEQGNHTRQVNQKTAGLREAQFPNRGHRSLPGDRFRPAFQRLRQPVRRVRMMRRLRPRRPPLRFGLPAIRYPVMAEAWPSSSTRRAPTAAHLGSHDAHASNRLASAILR